MVSIWETLLEQTFGACITITTETLGTVICDSFGAPLWQPLIKTCYGILGAGK